MSNKESNFYTYLILDPRHQGNYIYDEGKLSLDYLPIYVGKGCGSRYAVHIKEAKRLLKQQKSQSWIMKNCDNPHKTRIIMKTLKVGLEPIVVKILENVDEQTAFDKEKELVWIIGRADMKMGSLTNKTWGGEGGINNYKLDLVDQKFGRLLVETFVGKDRHNNSLFNCLCDCGNEKIVLGYQLNNNKTKSCGCLNKDIITSHGLSNTPLHKTWRQIRQRCYNPNNREYDKIGGMGIIMCDRWLKFENFLEDIGSRPTDKHVMVRINDDNDYELSNCRWITKKEQANNRKTNRYLTIDGETKTLSEWIKISGAIFTTVSGRLQRGWSEKEAVFGMVE